MLREFVSHEFRSLFVDDARADDLPDLFVEASWQYPLEVLRFLKVSMLASIVSGILVVIPSGTFLTMYWERCRLCKRPLHMWVLAHCALELFQTPERFQWVLQLFQMQKHSRSIEEIKERIGEFTQSSAWASSMSMPLSTCVRLALGCVWQLNSDFYTPCPGIRWLSLAVMLVAVAKVHLSTALFMYSFPGLWQPDGPPPPAVQGASQEIISALPLVEHSPGPRSDPPPPECAVCLCEFAEGSLLRQLPCGHRFHRECIDKWLARSKTCPLCVHDIEVPPPPRRVGRPPAAEAEPMQC